MKILKNWKIFVLIFFVILAIISIIPSSKTGVIVRSVSYDSPLYGKIKEGEYITWINEKTIETPDDFYAFSNFTGMLRFMHNGQLDLAEIKTPSLGVVVDSADTSKIKLGMDLVGGTRVLLKPEGKNVSDDIIDQTIATLQTRINTYGLKETKFQKVKDISGNSYVQIEMAGGSLKEIEELLSKQGKFEAKIEQEIKLTNNKGLYTLEENYPVSIINKTLYINNNAYNIGDYFKLEGIKFEYANLTNNSVIITPIVFTSSDIKSVCMQDQPGICVSRIMKRANSYSFMFQLFITQNAAERFAKLTKNLETIVDPNTGESYLESKLSLYLDNKLITKLSISSELAGRAFTQPSITGARPTKEEALKEKLMLQSILSSGELPVKLETIRVDQISPMLGTEFGKSALLAGLVALIAVSGVVFIKYRKLKIVIPIIITSVSEVIIILGAASWIGWTIDLAAIAGIIAAVGTGVDSQIMIIDELRSSKKTVYTLKQRIKRAFFIIFGAASTTIAAMLPLMFIGIGIMRGFAITTTIGVLVGILITRPAFGQIIEKVLENN
ncbi:MAG: hypothetical protein J7K26_00040 [Candidatus Aenigmarchaeota archaeon]|nr:hypothetical protein [Candidatus Aenigmarchaeota archaeon]